MNYKQMEKKYLFNELYFFVLVSREIFVVIS